MGSMEQPSVYRPIAWHRLIRIRTRSATECQGNGLAYQLHKSMKGGDVILEFCETLGRFVRLKIMRSVALGGRKPPLEWNEWRF
jgi:hypothetical protein